MELRIIRLIVTVGFIAMVTLFAVTTAGPWGYALGALLLGVMMAYLWREEAAAQADVAAHERVRRAQRVQQDREPVRMRLPGEEWPSEPDQRWG